MSYYSDNAEALFDKYNNIESASLHDAWLHLLPDQSGSACDIGAGTGRDANWLAEKGWDVIAVEPERKFRELARDQNHPNIAWVDDKLPDLHRVRKLGQRFNLILLSAVWMHLPENTRERAFRILVNLLAPGGILVISLRHSNNKEENKKRGFNPVSVEELEYFAKSHALSVASVSSHPDQQKRPGVSWETVILELPDDGTGSLPLLRHIIVNDSKAATYKLGLLRTLLRIADGAPGMVLRHTDEYVEIPFGLVGLYWIKLYMPLVLSEKLVQAPSHKPEQQKGLGFAKPAHFYRLKDLSPFDLRVGRSFGPEMAPIVIGAIKNACASIQTMPAHFITYPGQGRTVFDCDRASPRFSKTQHWRIDKDSLSRFGTFRLPLSLWQCMSQYACWIEPAILNEWARLMNSYNAQYDRSIYDRAFQWEDSRRETGQVRRIATEVQGRLAKEKKKLECVWTGKSLINKSYDIDHCFPWSRWFNNDLWNLLPASRIANNRKGEKLPSAELMRKARERIINWWDVAYIQSPFQQQFMIEAESALPLVVESKGTLEEIFDAILCQRARLKTDQQLQEWNY